MEAADRSMEAIAGAQILGTKTNGTQQETAQKRGQGRNRENRQGQNASGEESFIFWRRKIGAKGNRNQGSLNPKWWWWWWREGSGPGKGTEQDSKIQ